MVLFPTLFSEPRVESKHSTSVPSSTGSAVALSVDVKGPLVPNPLSDIAVKRWLVPLGMQVLVTPVVRCDRAHRLLLLLLPSTLQMVVPVIAPVTVHLKVKVSLGQVGGGAVSCPVTWPESVKTKNKTLFTNSYFVTQISFFCSIRKELVSE